MRVVVHGPAAGALPNGTIGTWGVDEVIEVDDADAALVAHWESMAEGPLAEILEPAAKAKPKDPPKAVPASKQDDKPSE